MSSMTPRNYLWKRIRQAHAWKENESERQGHTIYDRGMERGDQEQEKARTSVCSQPHAENWALKRKWRKIATKERRRAIEAHWATKWEELKQKPKKFYKTVQSFLNYKSKGDSQRAIKVDRRVVTNQNIVADKLCTYFWTVAKDISTAYFQRDFASHPNLRVKGSLPRSSLQFQLHKDKDRRKGA